MQQERDSQQEAKGEAGEMARLSRVNYCPMLSRESNNSHLESSSRRIRHIFRNTNNSKNFLLSDPLSSLSHLEESKDSQSSSQRSSSLNS
jgi:hypothetical protein